MKFKPLNIPDSWKHYWTKYPEGYTVMESLMDWVSQVNEMSVNLNDMDDIIKDFIKNFDSDLEGTLTNILNDMQADGRLEVIISNALQTQMDKLENNTNTKLSNFENKLANMQILLNRLQIQLNERQQELGDWSFKANQAGDLEIHYK